MRVLATGDNNPNIWKMEVSCTGEGWEQLNTPCGALLEVNQADIFKRAHTDLSGDTEVYYGVICPICGCFTEISTGKIPHHVRNHAKTYR